MTTSTNTSDPVYMYASGTVLKHPDGYLIRVSQTLDEAYFCQRMDTGGYEHIPRNVIHGD